MKKKFTLISFLALSVMLMLAGCAKKDDSKFVVGMECAYPPFNWTQMDDSNGAVPIDGTKEYAGGYDIEIAKKIADGLDKELVVVKTTWKGLLPSVDSGTIDAIIAGMSPTAERKEEIDFSDKYYTSDLVVVVLKDGAYANATSIQDFSEAKITAQQGTLHYTVIDQISGVDKQTEMIDFSAMRVALESGTIDGYISERPEGISATSVNDKFTMIGFEEGKGFETSAEDISISVGLKKGSDLTEKINKIIAGISEEERSELMTTAIKNQPAAE